MQHLDEGTMHAWLDGELPPAERQAAEEHVASCDECKAAGAEVRGFIAASSRILTALDAVPGGVLPASSTAAKTLTGSTAVLATTPTSSNPATVHSGLGSSQRPPHNPRIRRSRFDTTTVT